MVDFSYSLFTSPVSPYAGFGTGPKMARNKHGHLFAYLESGDWAVTANVIAISWLHPDGVTTTRVFTSNPIASNVAQVAAFETGEFYAVYCNYVGNTISVLYWPNIETNQTPQAFFYSGVGCANGKFRLLADPTRRCLYLIGSEGYFFVINQIGSERFRSRMHSGPYSGAHYHGLELCDNGEVALVACTARWVTTLNAPSYDMISYASIVNPIEAPPVVAYAAWGFGGVIGSPYDPGPTGPATWCITGEQSRAGNNILLDALVDGDLLYVLYSYTPAFGERFFDDPLLKNLNTCLHVRSRRDANVAQSQTNFRQLAGTVGIENYNMRGGSGVLTKCNGKIYVIGTMIDSSANWYMLALQIDSNGIPQLYARTQVTEATGKLLHYINGRRSLAAETTIEGSISVVDMTVSQWANASGSGPIPNTSLYKWSLAAA